jgi:hypothetical protein
VYEVQELRDYSVYADSLEGLTNGWTYQGFLNSTRRTHSGTHSFYSDSANNISNYIRTAYPYLVNPGDSFSFWCWYNLEKNYDAAVAEVSYDTKEWIQLGARLTDTAMSWRRKSYSLESYAGKSVYLQVRVMTDDNTLKNGFYIDDIYPVPFFANTRIVSSAITDTFYNISVSQTGPHWYRIKGSNLANGWGEYSMLDKVITLSSAVKENQSLIVNPKEINLNLSPNPFSRSLFIKYNVPAEAKVMLKVFDVQGRSQIELLNERQQIGEYQLVWNGRGIQNTKLAAGVYFIELSTEKTKISRRVVIY